MDGIDVLWFHRVDTSRVPVINKEPRILSSLKNFIREGGTLLLTQDAFTYIVDLGLEAEKPQVRYVEVRDSGYGRKIGLQIYTIRIKMLSAAKSATLMILCLKMER